MRHLMMTFAAALAAGLAGVSTPVMAAGAYGDAACRPEAGDNRVTRWTSEIRPAGFTIGSRGINQDSLNMSGSILKGDGYFDYTPPLPDDPKYIHFAVMGNDSKAGTVVLGGTRIGDLDAGQYGLTFGSSDTGVSGLKPNAHYVAVFYSPYLGFGNLRPFARYCFRTARDPSNPWGGSATGCFAPYTPTVGGTRLAANYTACVTARNACNAAANTTWERAGNRCIPASN